MEQPKKINPVEGVTYHNRNGADYVCQSSGWNGTAIVRHTISGWTLTAHDIRQYEDGSIEWDYSTDGHWPW